MAVIINEIQHIGDKTPKFTVSRATDDGATVVLAHPVDFFHGVIIHIIDIRICTELLFGKRAFHVTDGRPREFSEFRGVQAIDKPDMTQNVYFQETPKQPSAFRAELRQAGRSLAFNGN